MVPSPVLPRRSLLLGAAGGLVLASCGRGSSGGDASATTDATTAADADRLFVAPVFAPEQPAGQRVRLPLAIAGADGVLVDEAPRTISVRVGPEGGELGEAVEVERHDQAIGRPYFPLITTLSSEGSWRIEVEAGGRAVEPLTVAARPASSLPAVPVVGDPLPSLATPTLRAAEGVDPICTRDPPCPLHEVSLDAALAEGRPLALLVSTPAYCQTAICGPVLDLLVSRSEQMGARATFVHAEVYTDDTARATTPVVSALGLTYEPSLFLVAGDGTVVERLDYTFDAVELDEVVDRWLAA